MERLTNQVYWANGKHKDYLGEYSYVPVDGSPEDLCDRVGILEDQGLLLVLPCRVGDTIYVIPSRANYKLNIINDHAEDNRVFSQIVHSVHIFGNGGYLLTTCEGIWNVSSDFYGKTWFLTQKQAEEALNRMEENDAGRD